MSYSLNNDRNKGYTIRSLDHNVNSNEKLPAKIERSTLINIDVVIEILKSFLL